MKKKALVIFPGLSSPNCDQYVPVYELLTDGARQRLPHASVELLTWPGQLDSTRGMEGEFSIPTAVEYARAYLKKRSDCEYLLLARSSGCNVAASLLLGAESPANVGRVAFWGPPPYWLYYEMFVVNREQNLKKAEKTGVRISDDLVLSTPPFEALLQKIPQEVLLATGTLDEHCPPSYLNYLRKTLPESEKLFFAVVDHCPHAVTSECKNADGFLDKVIGWLAGDTDTGG